MSGTSHARETFDLRWWHFAAYFSLYLVPMALMFGLCVLAASHMWATALLVAICVLLAAGALA